MNSEAWDDTLQNKPFGRFQSIDILRGVVMILMALDHVRVYAGVPAGGITPELFFTRWVTHFCAPVFIFFAGTGAFFHGRKLGNTASLSSFLATRGIWLIFLEFTFLRLAWTFNGNFSGPLLAGIIWVIGICMVIMAGVVWLPPKWILGFGLIIVAGHNLFDPLVAELTPKIWAGEIGWPWQFLYLGGPIFTGGDVPMVIVLYSIVPWIGVMMAGYGFGLIVDQPAEKRRKYCLQIGTVAILLFAVLRGFNLYGNPQDWSFDAGMPALLSFLGTEKYPASFLFLLMTLGPVIFAIPFLDHVQGKVWKGCQLFGRVPLFYYLLHIPLIHAMALLVDFLRTGEITNWLFDNHPIWIDAVPDGYMWGLGLLYLIWAITVVLLYFPCKWYAGFKKGHPQKWVSYL